VGSFQGLQFYSIDLPVCHCTSSMQFYHNCSVIQLEIRNGDSTKVSFIAENSFCYSSPLVFQMNLQIGLSNSMKNWFGILMGIELNLKIAFSKITIFTMLILPIHEHGRYFHLLRSWISSQSCSSCHTDISFPQIDSQDYQPRHGTTHNGPSPLKH
jgi:hypothetical protein